MVIVEDSADARLSLQKKSSSAKVTPCTRQPTGRDAIAHLRPDVALIDIGLPGLDGYRLAEQLRSTGQRTYLIALTGYGLAEDRSRAQAAGFHAHMTKPPAMDRRLALVSAGSASPDRLARR